VAEHGGREREGQRGDGVDQVLAGKVAVGEQPGNAEAERHGDERGGSGNFETEPEREPVEGHWLDTYFGTAGETLRRGGSENGDRYRFSDTRSPSMPRYFPLSRFRTTPAGGL